MSNSEKLIKITNCNTLKGHRGVVFSVQYSPDGKKIVSGSEDK
jgi:WD40 repeat protein